MPSEVTVYAPRANRPDYPAASTEFADDLKGVLQILRRRAWVFALTLVIVVSAAAAWLYTVTPLYTAEATVLLDPRRQVVTGATEVIGDYEPDSAVIDTQVTIIRSRAVLGRAVDSLLQAEAGLTLAQDKPKGGSGVAYADTAVALDKAPAALREEYLTWLRDGLEVSRIGLTYTLEIAFTGEDPEEAALVANTIADAYLGYQRDYKQEATRDATRWLEAYVADLRAQMDEAENAVDTFRTRSGLLVARGATLTESELTSQDVALNDARQALSEARAKLETYLDAVGSAGPAGAANIVSTPMMQQLRMQHADVTGEREQLAATFGPRHPQMLQSERQLEAILSQMHIEAARTVEELQNDVSVAQNRVASLVEVRNDSRTQLEEDNAASVELTQLIANAQSLRSSYESTLTRLQETSAQQTLGQVNARVVSEAIPPGRASSPNAEIVLAGASGAGLAMGAFFVMLLQIFDGKTTRPEDFSQRTGMPVLALVPRLKRRDLKIKGERISVADYVLHKPLSMFAEAYRGLRVAIVNFAGQGRAPLVVQFTSSTFAEGKTSSALAFARLAAIDGRRVLLIDADTRRKSITRELGIETERGLIELLRGSAGLSDVIVKESGNRRPQILPLSKYDQGPHDRFTTTAFEQLMTRLRQSFDFIVIDSAPVLAVAEPLSLAQHADAVVLVSQWSRTPTSVVNKALEELHRAGAKVVGAALTQVDLEKVTRQSYGRGYYTALLGYYQ